LSDRQVTRPENEHARHRALPQPVGNLCEPTQSPLERPKNAMGMQHETLWNEAVAFTRAKSPASFEQWFSGVQYDGMTDGVVSLRARTKIYYDAANMKVTNSSVANDLLKRDYRNGFKLTL